MSARGRAPEEPRNGTEGKCDDRGNRSTNGTQNICNGLQHAGPPSGILLSCITSRALLHRLCLPVARRSTAKTQGPHSTKITLVEAGLKGPSRSAPHSDAVSPGGAKTPAVVPRSGAGLQAQARQREVQRGEELVPVVVTGELVGDVPYERELLGVERPPRLGETAEVLVAVHLAVE